MITFNEAVLQLLNKRLNVSQQMQLFDSKEYKAFKNAMEYDTLFFKEAVENNDRRLTKFMESDKKISKSFSALEKKADALSKKGGRKRRSTKKKSKKSSKQSIKRSRKLINHLI